MAWNNQLGTISSLTSLLARPKQRDSRRRQKNKGARGKRGGFEKLEPRYLLSGTPTDYFWFAETPLDVGASPQSVLLADLNQDGLLDLITAHESLSRVSIRLGNGDGTFQDPTHYGFGEGAQPYGLATTDVNGDGKLDILVSLRSQDQLTVLLGDGAGGVSLGTPITTGDYPTKIAVADLDGDGRNDLVTANYNDGTLSVVLANEEGGFATPVSYEVDTNPFSVAVADVNKDGTSDILAICSASKTLVVLTGEGDGTFQDPVTLSIGQAPYGLVVGDVNGDTNLDVVVSQFGDHNVQVFINDGTGQFTAGSTIATKQHPGPTALVDANNDGVLDIVVASTTNDTVQVFLGSGDGTFTLWREAAVGLYPTDLATGDLNGDGRLDLVTANYEGSSVSILLQELDTQAPTSQFTSTITEAWGIPVNLSWSGDDGTGSGVASYSVWYRRAGETDYTLWLANTTETSGLFQAEPGYTYELVVTASDVAGNVESLPEQPEATLTLTVRPVDFLVLSDMDSGETLYPIKTTQAGVLTLLASDLDGEAGERIQLYNANKELVATSTTQDGSERIDWTASAADEVFYFKLTGEDASTTLTLVNLVAIDGQHVTVSGTADVEWLVVTTATRQLAINGVVYAWPEGDQVQIEAHGGEGDWAQLYDSVGDDHFTAKRGESVLQGTGYKVTVHDYYAVHAYRKSGSGNDVAQLFDTTGDEVVIGRENYLRVRGEDFVVRAKFFANTSVDYTGGNDRLKLYGSPAADTLSITTQGIQFQTGAQLIHTNIFPNVFIAAQGEGDTTIADTGEEQVALNATTERLRILAADLSYVLRLTGFDSITARNYNTASTKTVAPAVDYLMLEGTWAS